MTARDLFGVLVRLLGVSTTAWAIASMLAPLMDQLGALAIGLVLWMAAGPIATLAYGSRHATARTPPLA